MKITYIHHSSFSVELEHVTLLFDYYEGPLPEFSIEKPLVVFASHAHSDHFSPIIFKLSEGRNDVFYVLSKDIKKRDVPEALEERVWFVKAGETFILEACGLTVETFLSTDEGVAFWVNAEGKQIYHAGDLNNWWWEGESKAWNHNISANYTREIKKMDGRHADAAFVPLDPRQEQQFYLGMDEFMRNVSVDAVFPMHFWKDYGIIQKMKEHPCSVLYRDKIMTIHEEGEEFVR